VRIAHVVNRSLDDPIKNAYWDGLTTMLWNLKIYSESRGHECRLFTVMQSDMMLHDLNNGGYDFVHCHSDSLALPCATHLAGTYAISSYDGRWSSFASKRPPLDGAVDPFAYWIKDTFRAPALLPPATFIADEYRRLGYRGFLERLPTGVEATVFAKAARGSKQAVCVGPVGARLRQAMLAEWTEGRVPVDFVGPWDKAHHPAFGRYAPGRYLGQWPRTTMYDTLTEYRCLVLLSVSDSAPAICRAALAAGLSLVITPACAADLGSPEFIHVLSEEELRRDTLVAAIENACEANDRRRSDIIAYAHDRWDFSATIPRYLELVDQIRHEVRT